MADPSFSPSVFALTKRLQEEITPEERTRLSLEIAEAVIQDYDPTDASNIDAYHFYFEDFLRARFEYYQAAHRLGRLVSQSTELMRLAPDISTN